MKTLKATSRIGKLRRNAISLTGIFLFAVAALPGNAQRQELAGSLGALLGGDRSSISRTKFNLDPDLALGLSYEHRVFRSGPFAVYGGLDFVASQHRGVNSNDRTLTRDVATIYVTPNVMVKLTALRGFTPWATIGGGVSVYEQSLFQIDGLHNPASRDVTHGAFEYGGGVDVPIWRFVALRGQIKDFYSGSPSYNTPVSGGQQNVFAGGALVLRWGS